MTTADIVNLNVGGVRFSTSRETLTWIPDSFFSSMLSGRISTLRDEEGAIFIDRDPQMFTKILNYLRTKDIDLSSTDLRGLRHEAEFYGITPLVRRLMLCESLEEPSCGDIIFHGTITPPSLPFPQSSSQERRTSDPLSTDDGEDARQLTPVERYQYMQKFSRRSRRLRHPSPSLTSVERCDSPSHSISGAHCLRAADCLASETDLTKKEFLPCALSQSRITIMKGHHNWLAAAYPHFVCLYRLKDSVGWYLVWTSPYLEETVDRIAVNAKVSSPSQDSCRLVAASTGTSIQLWSIPDKGDAREIGVFDLSSYLEHLFFSGSQLVALSPVGKVGVWHAMTQNWQIQDVVPICSYDTSGSFLLLGCENGSIYYIDMQKFPLRMKDNDLLVTELYKDPAGEMVTALSFYLTPKTSLSGNWLEIAYGTDKGKVRVIVQHPETGGQGPQLFQTFSVHTSPVVKVMLSEKNLISVCSDYNHVRSWSVTRFRGMISTQPGSMPLASFKVASLDYLHPMSHYNVGNDIGPFGEKDDQQVFVQKVVPDTDTVFVRLASSGTRVCTVKSADGSEITAFCVHECEGSTRMGSRPRRFLFTGHSHGGVQIWDLSTALDRSNKGEKSVDDGGPSATELMLQLDLCDLTNSCSTTPSISPSPSLLNAIYYGPRGFSPASANHTPERIRRIIPDSNNSPSRPESGSSFLGKLNGKH